MQNRLITIVTALALTGSALARQDCHDPDWEEQFDTMDTGGRVIEEQACVPLCSDGFSWQAWSLLAGHADAVASDLFARSAPNSVRIVGRADPASSDYLVHTFTDATIGTYFELTTMVYVPVDMTGVGTFSVLNTYEVNGAKNTSVELTLDGDRGVVETFGGVSTPMVRGKWVELQVVVSLYADRRLIRYNDAPLGGWQSWSEGVTGGGDQFEFAALALHGGGGPTAASPVYYDDFVICTLEPFGACCFRTDPCLEGVTGDECIALQSDAVYHGDRTSCASEFCPSYGPDGWEITDRLGTAVLPFVWEGDTCNDFPGVPFDPDCEFFPADCSECDLEPASQDQAWAFTIPWAGTWTFSTCGNADFDTILYGSTTATCLDDGPSNDDCERAPGETDSEFSVYLDPAAGEDLLLVTLEGRDGQCGPYELRAGARCEPVVTVPDMEIHDTCNLEDPENIGCFNELPNPPTFTDIACGDTFGGSTSASPRLDLDWFRLELDEARTITFTARANFPRLLLFMNKLNEDPGPGEDECTGWYSFASEDTRTCVDEDGNRPFAEIELLLPPGLYAPIVMPDNSTPNQPAGLGGLPCDAGETTRYEFTMACEDHCVPNPDADRDGCVAFGDILEILANWEGTGPADVDCSGTVDFEDLLDVLSAWGGPPPPSILCVPFGRSNVVGDHADYRSALAAATGGPVDFIDGALTPPSLDMMLRYTAVHVWADPGYNDLERADRLGARLKEYLDAGGCVILGTGCADELRNSAIMQLGASPVQRRTSSYHVDWDVLESFDPTSCAYRGISGDIVTTLTEKLEPLGEDITVDGIYPDLPGPAGFDGEIGLAYHGTDPDSNPGSNPKSTSPRIFYVNGSGGPPFYNGDAAGAPSWIARIVAECHGEVCE